MANVNQIMQQAGTALAMFAQSDISDSEALELKNLQKPWIVGEEVVPGDRRLYKDVLYKVKEGQGHTTQADWTPDITPAMWEVVDEQHTGTKEDPIPWLPNMQCYKGKFYTEDEKLYECTRDSGITLAYKISDLIGTYFSLSE